MNFIQHHCQAALITCIDFRFHEEVLKYFEKQRGLREDLLTVAGVAKQLTKLSTPEFKLIKKELEISENLHGIKEVLLVAHQDCGAYGGSKAFANLEEEFETYTKDMQKAVANLQKHFPRLKFMTFIAAIEKDKLVMREV